MTKGYTLDDGVMPEVAGKYNINKLGIVEETSSSVTHDFNTYALISFFYYSNHLLYFNLFEKVVWPRFLEGMGR